MMASGPDQRKALKAFHHRITKKFQPLSLFLRRDATELIVSTLQGYSEQLNDTQIERALGMIATAVSEHDLSSQFVGKDVIEDVLSKLSNGTVSNEADNVHEDVVLQIIDAFDTPKLSYSVDHKQFVPVKGTLRLHSSLATPKAALHRERFNILRQRTLRHALFRSKLEGTEEADGAGYKLTPLSALLGHSRFRGTGSEGLIVLGMLAQLEEGKYYLEDLDGKVRLSLADASPAYGLYTENSIVIVEGTYEDEVFHARTIAQPPSEPRSASVKSMGALNYFGGVSNAGEQAALGKIEIEEEGAIFVVVSDVWLDKPVVLDKLRRMFEGFSMMDPPPVFVFMGNFLSQPYGADTPNVLKGAFDTLCDVICEFPELSQKSNFIFVPGPKDPGAPPILPRRRLPRYCTERLQTRVKKAVFTSNPARVRYCTQELVFFREDIVNKMRRNCILTPSIGPGEPEITAHLVKTLLDQATLVPLPLHVSPIYWEYEHALGLYPTPDVLVLADIFDSYINPNESTGTTAINPGPFLPSDFSFLVYYPSHLRLDPNASEENRLKFESRAEFSKIS
eukprot:m.186937 g.186937  ORF g.186937 m.186937 type:complete len:565 (-) comp16932_c0_seq1:184-1878(-)